MKRILVFIYICIYTINLSSLSQTHAKLIEVEKDGKTYLVETNEDNSTPRKEISYTLPEVLAATEISNRVLLKQTQMKPGRIYNILLRLETYENTLNKSTQIKTINLIQQIILEKKRPSPKGYIHLNPPIFEEEEEEEIETISDTEKTEDAVTEGEDKTPIDALPPSSPEQENNSATPIDANIGTDRIDHTKIRDTRISWTNELRASRDLTAYIHQPLLSTTSKNRSQELSNKGIADHKRTSNATYYDYTAIESRFSDQGVIFINHSRATFTENIGRSSYNCPTTQTDCTDEAITAMKRIFDFFVAEAPSNGVHWRTLIHPQFTEIGVDLTINESETKLYGVMHYAAEAIQKD